MRNAGLPAFAAAAAVLSLGAPAPAAGQAFEGAVTYQIKSEGRAMEMTQMYKGGQVRTEMDGRGQKMVMLLDGAGQKMTMLMPDHQMYMTMDLKQMAGMAGQEHRHDPGEAKVTDLHTTETIAGRKCSNYLVGEKQDVEVCAASGMGFYAAARSPMGRGPTSSLPELGSSEFGTRFKDGFFPLRVSQVQGGKKQVILEATKVEQKSLDASLFSIPEGYTQMQMPGRP